MANTKQPRLLFETSLPIRYYIPKTDCKLELLAPSATSTACPYKVRAAALPHSSLSAWLMYDADMVPAETA